MRPTLTTLTLALLLSTAPSLLAAESAAPEPGPWHTVSYGDPNPPTLSCSPLSACMVALQPGETVVDRFLADSANWEVQIGSAGAGVPVLAVKPHRCGISSNLFVTTSRRVYPFVLLSPDCDPATLKASKEVDLLRFTYPGDFAASLGEPAPLPPTPSIPTQASRLSELNFDYSFSAGRHAAQPRIVYDDGAKTFIVLRPEDLRNGAPAVFIYGDGGKLNTVNFTPPAPGGSTYVVDRVVPQLVLVSGKDQRCVITRGGAR